MIPHRLTHQRILHKWTSYVHMPDFTLQFKSQYNTIHLLIMLSLSTDPPTYIANKFTVLFACHKCEWISFQGKQLCHFTFASSGGQSFKEKFALLKPNSFLKE